MRLNNDIQLSGFVDSVPEILYDNIVIIIYRSIHLCKILYLGHDFSEFGSTWYCGCTGDTTLNNHNNSNNIMSLAVVCVDVQHELLIYILL